MLGKGRTVKKLNDILKDEYSKGSVPRSSVVSRKLYNAVSDMNLEAPSFSPADMPHKSRFNVESFNESTSQLHDDVGTLYSENMSITADILRQISLHDGLYRSQMNSLRTTRSQLNDLLLTDPRGGAALLSVYDDFTDMSKVDQANTTAHVDLTTDVTTLPANKSATKRLTFMHLSELTTFDVTVTEPSVEVPTHVHQPPGSSAGAIFDDTLLTWQYLVHTHGYDGRLSIEFAMDLSTSGLDVSFSRLDIGTMCPSETEVMILTTRDHRNWLALPGYTSPMIVDNTPVTLRFPTVRAKAVKVVLTKRAPDGKSKPPGSDHPDMFDCYKFGLTNLSFYAMGYPAQAILRSKTLVPVSTGIPITKAALYINEFLPEGTDIKYEIAHPTDIPEWVEIAPMERDVEGVPKVIDFGNAIESPRHENHIILPSGEVYGTGIHGVTLHNIGTVEHDPVWGSAKLWRGKNAWTRSVSEVRSRELVHGCQVYFSKDDRFQQLYITSREEEPYEIVQPSGIPSTALHMQHTILTDPEGAFSLTPDRSSTGPDIPGYSIERVVHVMADTYGGDFDGLGTGSVRVVNIGRSRRRKQRREVFLVLSTGDEIKYKITHPLVYLDYTAEGRHIRGMFKIKGSDWWSRPEAEFRTLPLEDPDQVLRTSGNVTWAMSHVDITHWVTSVDKNVIYIDSTYPYARQGERILVTYRHILDDGCSLISDTVEVLPNAGPPAGYSKVGSAPPYVLGNDYSIDPTNASIRHLRAGKIPIHDEQPTILSVNFEYWAIVPGQRAYSTFFVLEKQLDRLQLGSLQLDTFAGDKLYLYASGNTYDLTEIREAVSIPAGIVQVVVYSSDLLRFDGTVDEHSAIYKVMNVLDTEGNMVFNRGSRYWGRQVALPEPMKQVSYHNLLRSVSKDDRRFFAVSDRSVWTNYNPSAATDMVALNWENDPIVLSNDAEFEALYKYTLVTGDPGILFKATLMLDPDMNADVTPILDKYTIRFV